MEPQTRFIDVKDTYDGKMLMVRSREVGSTIMVLVGWSVVVDSVIRRRIFTGDKTHVRSSDDHLCVYCNLKETFSF